MTRPASRTDVQRKLTRVLIVALAGVALAACEREIAEPVMEPLTVDEISGERLWDRISIEAPYESYSFWPGEEGVQPGQAPHGQFHRIFVNRDLYNAVPIMNGQAPDGTVIVKENLSPSEDLISYTVMAKVEGFDPENGDWFWAAYGPDGMLRADGAVSSCIACHEGMRANDYIIVRRLTEPLE